VDLLYDLLVVLHLVGMAAVVGGWITVLRAPRIVTGMVHGALLQVVTGVALVGLAEGSVDRDLDYGKMTVKLVVALAVAVLAFLHRKRERVPAGVVHAVGGLALLNVLVAVLWD
jgi:membrane protein required for beta-lactamase induction